MAKTVMECIAATIDGDKIRVMTKGGQEIERTIINKTGALVETLDFVFDTTGAKAIEEYNAEMAKESEAEKETPEDKSEEDKKELGE